MSRAAPLTACALVLSLTGCAGAGASEPLGVAREADGARPIVGFPIDVAPAERVPVLPEVPVVLAGGGHDYLAVWPTFASESVAFDAVRFDASGLAKDPIRLAELEKEFSGNVVGVACAPNGDCLVLSAVQGFDMVLDAITLRADGDVKRASLPIEFPSPPGAVAFDPAADAFLVVWSAPNVKALHFAGGAPVEPAPLDVAIAANALRGLACSTSSGCLLLVAPDQAATEGVIVTAAGASSQFVVSSDPLGFVTYGGGVYFTIEPAPGGFGAVRLGLDGLPLDAAPLPITTLTQTSRSIVGAGFDGTSFVAVTQGFDLDHGHETNQATVAGRLRPDGTAPSPASVDLGGLALQGAFACATGACELALVKDSQGLAALSTAAIRGGAVEASDHDLVEEPASQENAVALPLAGKVLVLWNEGLAIRSRWFDGGGHATSAPRDLGVLGKLGLAASADDAGLVLIQKVGGGREARVVAADGTLGPAVPFEPPAKPERAHAHFALLERPTPEGVTTVVRFDAEGHVLGAEPLPLAVPGDTAGARMARAGDTFVIARKFAEDASGGRVDRVRDTGEYVDATDLLPIGALLSAPGGVACDGDDCVVGWFGTNSTGGRDTPEIWTTRFSASDGVLHLDAHYLARGSPEDVVFDGKAFLAVVSRKLDVGAVRVEAGAKVGKGMLNGDRLVSVVGAGDGAALVLSDNQVDLGTGAPSTRLLVQSVLDGLGDGEGGGGAAPETTTPSGAAAAGGGCACQLGASGDAPCAIAVLLLAAAQRRRSRR